MKTNYNYIEITSVCMVITVNDENSVFEVTATECRDREYGKCREKNNNVCEIHFFLFVSHHAPPALKFQFFISQ